MVGSSSTFSLNSIVDNGIVNDIVDEIVTCGRDVSDHLLTYCTRKSQYYINVVNENKNGPKKLWHILKEVGSSTKCKTKERSISLDIGN